MKTATRAEAERDIGALLEVVKRGETVVILESNQPIARIEPAQRTAHGDAASEEAQLARLERMGLLRRGHGRPLETIVQGERIRPESPVDSAALIRAERDAGW